MKNIHRSRGFMQIVVLAIVIIAALSYFNIDLHSLGSNPIVQKVWGVLVVAWAAYIKPLLMYLWTSIPGLSAK